MCISDTLAYLSAVANQRAMKAIPAVPLTVDFSLYMTVYPCIERFYNPNPNSLTPWADDSSFISIDAPEKTALGSHYWKGSRIGHHHHSIGDPRLGSVRRRSSPEVSIAR